MEASTTAKNTFNPIRNLVDNCKVKPNPNKKVISLSLGDPTVFGNLKTADEVTEAVCAAVKRLEANGYAPVIGTVQARQAIVNRYKKRFSVEYSPSDVVITSGCSGALDLAISVLCSPGDGLLMPEPGFTLYKTLAGSKGIKSIGYPLDENLNWQIKLSATEQLMKSHSNKVKAWIINNPSNPCGSVYSKEHLIDCLKLASKYEIVVIADEIYEDMVFEGNKYFPMAGLNQESLERKVSILTCSGLAKRFLVPGWRFGWIAMHEAEEGHLSQIRKGLFDLSTLIIGSCTLIQAALPEIFENTPEIFFQNTNELLQANARYLCRELAEIEGLHVIEPQGTLYMLIGVDYTSFKGFTNDVELSEQLLVQESISVLPASIFGIPGYFRIVYSAPMEILKEFIERIKKFFASNRVK